MPIKSTGTLSFSNISTELGISLSNVVSLSQFQKATRFRNISSPSAIVTMSNFYSQTADASSFYRIVPQGVARSVFYETTSNHHILGSNRTTTTSYVNNTITQCNILFSNIDQNVQGYVGFSDIRATPSNWLRHSLSIIRQTDLTSNNYDFAWQFVRSFDVANNSMYIFNAYNQPTITTGVGGYYLGYSNDNRLLISADVNYITKWMVYPLNVQQLNIKPMAYLYSILSVTAQDLVGQYVNTNPVLRWGKLIQTTASSAPIFYVSNGFLNRPYVNFDTISKTMTLNISMNARFVNTTINNFLGVSSSTGFSYFILCNITGITNSHRLLNTYINNANDNLVWQRNGSEEKTSYVALNINNNLACSATVLNSLQQNVWRVYGVRYRQSDGLLTVNTIGKYAPNYFSTVVSSATAYIYSPSNTTNITMPAGTIIMRNSPMNVDSFHLLDNYIDDTSTWQIMNAMITAGNIPSTPSITSTSFEYTLNTTSNDQAYIGNTGKELIPTIGTFSYALGGLENGSNALNLSANGTNGNNYPSVAAYVGVTTGALLYNNTFSIWVKQTSAMTVGNGYIITARQLTTTTASCYVTPSNLVLELQGSGPALLTSNVSLVGTWNHVAFTIANSNYLAMYLNGKRIASSNITFDYSTVLTGSIQRINLSQAYNNTNSNIGGFPGYMAYFKVHPFVLTDAQVAQLYYSTKVYIPNLVFAESFGDVNIPTIDDLATNALTNSNATIARTPDRGCVLRVNTGAYMLASSFDIPTNYTKMAWVYHIGNTGGARNIISSAPSSSTARHYLYFQDGTSMNITAGHSSTTSILTYVSDPTPLLPNTWTHFALTYDNASTTMRLYRNGSNVSSATNAALAWSGGNGRLGIGTYINTNNFNGYIDNVNIYSRALTAWEVNYIYDYELNNPRL